MDFDMFATIIFSKMHHHKMIDKIDTGSLGAIDTRLISTIDHHGTQPLDDLFPISCRMLGHLFRQRE